MTLFALIWEIFLGKEFACCHSFESIGVLSTKSSSFPVQRGSSSSPEKLIKVVVHFYTCVEGREKEKSREAFSKAVLSYFLSKNAGFLSSQKTKAKQNTCLPKMSVKIDS